MKLIALIHYLRQNGFSLTTSETIDAFRAIEVLDLTDEADVRFGLRTVLCATKAEYEAFDELFTIFFRVLAKRSERGMPDRLASSSAEGTSQAERGDTKTIDFSDSDEESARESIGERSPSSLVTPHSSGSTEDTKERSFLQAVRQSRAEAQHRITTQVPRDGFPLMRTIAKHVVRHMRLTPGRRWHPMPKGRRIDFRRTMRRSLSTGGYPIDLAWYGQRKRPARFVLLCDGSRSMASYAMTFLQFAYALSCQEKDTELFLFSTRVRRVTRALRSARPPHMPVFSQLGAEWGGGTRIGEAFLHVIREEGLRLLNANTVVIIFSDGLDSGHPDELQQAMRVLKRRVHRVIWLNPLASTPGYEPKARGMRVALPYVDLFSAAHDAASFYRFAYRIRRGRDGIE